MGNIFAQGRDISCDFCDTGTEGLRLLILDPSKGQGNKGGEKTQSKICGLCRARARNSDPQGWNRRLESGRYKLEEI